jgi:O-antigen/teichoic acid export membrane protein
MNNVKKSIGISLAGQYVELLINIMAVMVLARILTPADIGAYTVAAFLMAVLNIFRDFGVVQYVIQERQLTTDRIRSAMGVTIMLAFAVAAILLVSSRPIAHFYGDPQIEKILWAMSASFAISPLGSFPGAIFRREMQFKKIFFTRIVSTLCHVSVAISFAMNGFGALSLALANFAGILAIGIASNMVRPKDMPWLPKFSNIRNILSFGGIASLGNALNIAGTNSPDLFVGKMLDMTAVGYLSRASGLVQLFNKFFADAILPLILPYFALLRREGGDLQEYYLSSVAYVTAIAWPFFATMMLLALPILRILYGPQWDASVPLVESLCIAGAVSAVSIFAGQVMVANGRVRSSTYAQLIIQPFRISVVFLACHYGLEYVAIAIVVSEVLSLVIVSWYLGKTISIGPLLLARACGKSAIVTLCCAIVPLVVKVYWTGYSLRPGLPVFVAVLGGAIGWISGMLLTRHPLTAHLISAFHSARFASSRKGTHL